MPPLKSTKMGDKPIDLAVMNLNGELALCAIPLGEGCIQLAYISGEGKLITTYVNDQNRKKLADFLVFSVSGFLVVV